MARLNIEMDVFADARFLDLVVITGDPEKAIGMLVSFWMVAQKYWVDGRKHIPTEVFNRRKWQPLLEVGLGEATPNGIYARGSEQRFDWLLLCKEAGSRGGKKSAESRGNKFNDLHPRVSKGGSRVAQPPFKNGAGTCDESEVFDAQIVSSSNGDRDLHPRVAQGFPRVSNLLTPVLTPTLNKNRTTEKERNLEQVPAGSKNDRPPEHENLKPVGSKNKQQQTDGSKIWETYSAAYLHRYKIEPKRNTTTNSQCSNLVKRLGSDDAKKVVQFYLTHNNSWYVKNCHTIGLCLKDAESLFTQMSNGTRVTQSHAQKIDRGSEQAEMFARVTKELTEKYDGGKK